jgi:formylmethanofuran dehydrogenase subunit E
VDIFELYEKSAEFHGHKCPGLAIGVRAAVEARSRLGTDFSDDEQMVCITENDACGVDGIQVILGCTAGKGNLIFRMRGKHAYSFYNRKNSESVRLILKELPKLENREAKQSYILEAPFDEIFLAVKPKYELPEEARLFESVNCEICGENTAEPYVRIDDGKKVCLDCCNQYSRN